jgi:hypothetical protein
MDGSAFKKRSKKKRVEKLLKLNLKKRKTFLKKKKNNK